MYKSILEPSQFDFGSASNRVELTEDPNFTFGHYKVGVGNATVCGAKVGDKLYYAVTFCSPEDNFSKEAGRIFALDHFIEEEYSHLRGVMCADDSSDELPPAIMLKDAVSHRIGRMRPDRKPQWIKRAGGDIDFRRPKKNRAAAVDQRVVHTHPITVSAKIDAENSRTNDDIVGFVNEVSYPMSVADKNTSGGS